MTRSSETRDTPAIDSAAPDTEPPLTRQHGGFITELGLSTTQTDKVKSGSAPLVPELCVPGTDVLRTSVLATWADVLAGTTAFELLAPRISVTLDLDVQLHRPGRGQVQIRGVSRVVKAGRSVVVCDVWFDDGDPDDPIAVSHLSFMASPNPDHIIPDGMMRMERPPVGRLPCPLAERVGCRIVGPGVAEIPRSLDAVNAAGNLQGGLIALAAEDAAADGAPGPIVASGLSVRYLRPVSVGPARATAEVHGSLARVEAFDAGRNDLLAAVAVIRSEPISR